MPGTALVNMHDSGQCLKSILSPTEAQCTRHGYAMRKPFILYAQCKHEQVCGRLLAAYMALNPNMEAASAKRVAVVAVAHRCRELLEGMTPVLKVLACILRLQLDFNHILVHVVIRHKS